jgi:hypothetical protein
LLTCTPASPRLAAVQLVGRGRLRPFETSHEIIGRAGIFDQLSIATVTHLVDAVNTINKPVPGCVLRQSVSCVLSGDPAALAGAMLPSSVRDNAKVKEFIRTKCSASGCYFVGIPQKPDDDVDLGHAKWTIRNLREENKFSHPLLRHGRDPYTPWLNFVLISRDAPYSYLTFKKTLCQRGHRTY